MSRITSAILKNFEKHRVVFWYDKNGGSRATFDDLVLPEIVKIVVANNEFSIKHRLIILEPDRKFLVYIPAARPNDDENWLLDLVLANKEFKADAASLILTELNLPETLYLTVLEHIDFFKHKDRTQALQARLTLNDTEDTLKRQMIGVLCRETDISTETLLFRLLDHNVNSNIEVWGLIEKLKLDGFWWRCIAERYGYSSHNPTLYDFVLEVFKQSHTEHSALPDHKRHEALLMLRRWKDSTAFKKTFEIFSTKAAEDLGYASEKPAAIDAWKKRDDFSFIEQRILNFLAQGLSNQTIQPETVRSWIEARKTSYWFGLFKSVYAALEHANELRRIIQSSTWKFDSAEALLAYYTQTGYKGDYHYRKFMYEYDHDNRIAGLGDLARNIENLYVNKFQQPLNAAWILFVEGGACFNQTAVLRQRDFFNKVVRSYFDKDVSVFVIISDALRYESGEELCNRLNQIDKNEARIEPMIATLPTYTKAGMASLLPHVELSVDIQADVILADNQNVAGTVARSAVLAKALDGKATAVTFAEFKQLTANRESGRDWAKKYSVVYIFHNTVDKTGDDKISESRVFESTENAFKDIQDMLKTIHSMNRYNAIITADHGYLYQTSNLHDSDFVGAELPDGICKKNRRFVFGASLPDSKGMHRFSLAELGFVGEGDCLIPKGVMRLRQQGSGARFVHGGASLQELMIPVIRFNRKRETTVGQVEIAVLGLKPRITTNHVPVNFYQQTPIGDGLLPRTIIAGLYGEDGALLSDTFKYTFDFKSTESTNREKKHTFNLSSEISKYISQDIILRLDEQVANSNSFKIYSESRHQILITFANDFD
jgi:uncharacterized protein (TIGR02687 family)